MSRICICGRRRAQRSAARTPWVVTLFPPVSSALAAARPTRRRSRPGTGLMNQHLAYPLPAASALPLVAEPTSAESAERAGSCPKLLAFPTQQRCTPVPDVYIASGRPVIRMIVGHPHSRPHSASSSTQDLMHPTRPPLPGADGHGSPGKGASHERHTGKYGSDAHLVFHQEAHEPEPATRLRELFRPFVIRQVGHTVLVGAER
jgi:hypothetical protein